MRQISEESDDKEMNDLYGNEERGEDIEMSGRKDTILAYANQQITDAFTFDDQQDFDLLQIKDYQSNYILN